MAIGPLTNLARLERRRPGSLARAKSLVIMGGAVDSPGNITPHAEFNFYCDPLAAHEVLNSGVPLTLVDLAACRQVSTRRETAEGLRATSPQGQLALEIVQNWFKADGRRGSMLFYDQIALAAAIYPEVVSTRQVTVTVETGEAEAGASRAVANQGPVALVDRVDVPQLHRLLAEWLGWQGL